MRTTRSRRMAWHAMRALFASAVAGALLVAVPIGLWRAVGWPLPRVVPHADAFNSPIPDTVILNALAIVCWVAWSHLLVCIVIEAVGHLRGRATPRLPWSGGTQHLARWLVTSMAMVSISAQRASVPPLQYDLITHAVAMAPQEDPRLASVASTALRLPDLPPKKYTVVRRDTLWGIAERHLGDPVRWSEVFELNRGREQADGQSLLDPGLVRPGWVLEMPADATGLAPPPPTEVDGSRHSVVVTPGDSLSEIAAEDLGDAHRWPELFELNHDRPQPDGRSLHNPDLIRPGWRIDLPADPASTSAATAGNEADHPVVAQESIPVAAPSTIADTPASVPSAEVASTIRPSAANEPVSTTTRPAESSKGNQRVPFGTLGAGLGAVGVVVTLDRLRRIQQRRRMPGRPPHAPPVQLAEREQTLRMAADEAQPTVDRLDIALRAMARGLADRPDDPAPPILAVQVGPERLEFLLASPGTAPPDGFTSIDDGWVWTIDAAEVDALRAAAEWVAPMPGLVTIGMAKGGPLLVDLETAGSVQVLGPRDAQLGLLSQLALELSTSAWANTVNVVLVGLEVPGLAVLDHVRTAVCLDDVIEAIEMEAGAFAKELGVTGFASTFAARTGQASSDGWSPTIVLCAEAQDAASAARLTAVAGEGGQGVALVVAGAIPGSRWTFACDIDMVTISPLGLEVRAELVTPEEFDAVDALIEDAQVLDDLPPAADDVSADVDPPEPQQTNEAQAPPLLPDSEPAPSVVHSNGSAKTATPVVEAEVEVRLLGPVEIIGGQEQVPSGKLAELLAYLATHPAGVDGDRLQCALWPPDKPPSPKTFANAVSKARQRVGTRHFPPAGNQIYRLADTVTTDLVRFEAFVREASGHKDAAATATLRSALELVHGRPFTAVHGFHWAQPEGLVAHAEAVVVDAAHRLAQLSMEAGDLQSAEWAAAAGLLASPGNEALFRDRMIAADAAGNPAGVESVMNELCEFVEAQDPYDELHPDTVALYKRISRRHQSSPASAPARGR